jgi:hypothetical protein
MLLYTNALRQGQVGPVTAVLWIGEVVAPSAVGLALLGDTVLPGWELAAAAAGLATIGAAVVLGTAPASAATAQTDPSGVSPPAAPVAAIQAPRPQLWPTYAWPEPSRPVSAEVLSYADEAAPVRWWGPGTSPQLIWVPPERTPPAPAEALWRQPYQPERFASM